MRDGCATLPFMDYTPLDAVKNATILYAEDEPGIRENVAATLGFFAGEVLVAADGVEALELFRKRPVHIVISDVRMPRLDGIDLIKKIRELDPRVPVPHFSSHKDEEVLLEAVRLFLTDYLLKPFGYPELKGVLEKCGARMIEEGMARTPLTGNAFFDCLRMELIVDGKREELAKKEILFLQTAIRNRNRLLTREMLEELVWAGEEMTEAALRNLLFRLRKRLGKGAIATVQDMGFLMRLPD